jgi:hypothetical protein
MEIDTHTHNIVLLFFFIVAFFISHSLIVACAHEHFASRRLMEIKTSNDEMMLTGSMPCHYPSLLRSPRHCCDFTQQKKAKLSYIGGKTLKVTRERKSLILTSKQAIRGISERETKFHPSSITQQHKKRLMFIAGRNS